MRPYASYEAPYLCPEVSRPGPPTQAWKEDEGPLTNGALCLSTMLNLALLEEVTINE